MAGRRGLDRSMALLCFVWPFVYLSPYLITIPGIGRQSGNDFDIIYYRYKTYLLDVLVSHGQRPMWSPSEASGFPFYASPFTASEYPLNFPLAGFYRAFNGWSHHDHQVFTILAVAIFSLGLYRWLRATRLPILPALLAALALGVSMKVTELLRLTNAAHAAAWIPWILLGMTRCAERQSLLRGAAIVWTSTVMLLTAGYPYYIYYMQFLAGPYLAFLYFERSRMVLFAETPAAFPGNTRFLLTVGGAFVLAIAVCSPYLSKVAELISQLRSRVGGDFAFSTSAVWDLPSTLGSWVYPPAASAEGWYYFGAIHVLVLLLFFVGAIRRRGARLLDRKLATYILIWMGVLTWISLGRESHLFALMWKIWPGFASLRQWPRINILLVPAIALLLGRAYFALLTHVRDPAIRTRLGAKRVTTALALCFGVVASVQIAFLLTDTVSYQWPLYFARYFDHLPIIDKPWYLAMSIIAAFLLAWVFRAAHHGANLQTKNLGALAVGIVAIGALDTAPLGILQWSEPTKQLDLVRNRPYVIDRMELALRTPRSALYTTVPLTPSFNASGVGEWYFERYVLFLESQGIDRAALEQPERWHANADLSALLGLTDGKRLFVTSSIDHSSIPSFLADSQNGEAILADEITVARYTGDVLVVELTANDSAYLSFIDNWDPNWTARINGKAVEIEKLFGTFKAVRLQPGRSRVKFQYSPF